MKTINIKNRHRFRKVLITIGIIIASLVFLYCIACLFAKVLPYEKLKGLLVLEEFAYTALGALFGFGSSLILENVILKISKKKAFTNLVEEIIQMIIELHALRKKLLSPCEIIQIAGNQVERNDIEANADSLIKIFRNIKYYKDTIYFPIWESILQNGDLLYFREENYFNSLIKVYTRLIKIKHMIDDHNVDESNVEEVFNYLISLNSNINEFLTFKNDFEDSLLAAIDKINQAEENFDLKCYFEKKIEDKT